MLSLLFLSPSLLISETFFVFVFLVLKLIIVRVGADLCALFGLDELDVGESSAAAQGRQQQDQHQAPPLPEKRLTWVNVVLILYLTS